MNEDLINSAREIYNGMRAENKCFILPNPHYFSKVKWLAHDESPEGKKIAAYLHRQIKVAAESFNKDFFAEKMPEEEIPCLLDLVNTVYSTRGIGMYAASLPLYKQLQKNPYNKSSKMGCVLPGFADDVLRHVFENDNDRLYLNQAADDNVFSRYRLARFDRIMLYGDSLLSVVYAAYAYGMCYIDLGHYPMLTVLFPENNISREIAGFLRRLNINYQVYNKDFFQGIRVDMTMYRHLFILPPERLDAVRKYKSRSLMFYMLQHDFDEVFNAPYTDKKAFLANLNDYVAEFEMRLATHKQFRKEYPDFKRETAAEWRKLYRPEYIDDAPPTPENVENFLQEHEAKIKDLLINCRSM